MRRPYPLWIALAVACVGGDKEPTTDEPDPVVTDTVVDSEPYVDTSVADSAADTAWLIDTAGWTDSGAWGGSDTGWSLSDTAWLGTDWSTSDSAWSGWYTDSAGDSAGGWGPDSAGTHTGVWDTSADTGWDSAAWADTADSAASDAGSSDVDSDATDATDEVYDTAPLPWDSAVWGGWDSGDTGFGIHTGFDLDSGQTRRCAPGEDEACDGTCKPRWWLSDGECDAAWDCPEFRFDFGDCATPDSDGGWDSATLHGDCPAGEIADCLGACAPRARLGDGVCDDGSAGPDFLCAVYGADRGDCLTDDTGTWSESGWFPPDSASADSAWWPSDSAWAPSDSAWLDSAASASDSAASASDSAASASDSAASASDSLAAPSDSDAAPSDSDAATDADPASPSDTPDVP